MGKKQPAKPRGITATDAEWKWILKEAEREGRSAAGYVRQLIRREMDSQEEKKAS